MTVQFDARTLLYTQMSRGYVQTSEVADLLAKSGAGPKRKLEPIVAEELNAIREMSLSDMFADAEKHGADVQKLRHSIVEKMNEQFKN